MRDRAEHFCPCNPKAERMQPRAALSRSALLLMMTGFLPPISATHGRGNLPLVKVRMMPMPTS